MFVAPHRLHEASCAGVDSWLTRTDSAAVAWASAELCVEDISRLAAHFHTAKHSTLCLCDTDLPCCLRPAPRQSSSSLAVQLKRSAMRRLSYEARDLSAARTAQASIKLPSSDSLPDACFSEAGVHFEADGVTRR